MRDFHTFLRESGFVTLDQAKQSALAKIQNPQVYNNISGTLGSGLQALGITDQEKTALANMGIITQDADGRWDFNHNKLQKVTGIQFGSNNPAATQRGHTPADIAKLTVALSNLNDPGTRELLTSKNTNITIPRLTSLGLSAADCKILQQYGVLNDNGPAGWKMNSMAFSKALALVRSKSV